MIHILVTSDIGTSELVWVFIVNTTVLQYHSFNNINIFKQLKEIYKILIMFITKKLYFSITIKKYVYSKIFKRFLFSNKEMLFKTCI